MNREDIERLTKSGESLTIEFKRSTGHLRRAGETLCGMLNARGGRVLIGVTDDGVIVGQLVADSTLQEVAAMLAELEPPAPVRLDRVSVDGDNEVLVLTADVSPENLPSTFRGRAFYRVETTTSPMSLERFQTLLLERAHSRRRWENEMAGGYEHSDLDGEEVLRTVRAGIESGRLPESTSKDIDDVLERLGLCTEGTLLNAAVVLFGARLLPEYTQCQLRMARFRGVDKSEFLDQRQLDGHAFHLLGEAMLFLRRHLPVAGRVQAGLFERKDEPLIPVAALREALVNAFAIETTADPAVR